MSSAGDALTWFDFALELDEVVLLPLALLLPERELDTGLPALALALQTPMKWPFLLQCLQIAFTALQVWSLLEWPHRKHLYPLSGREDILLVWDFDEEELLPDELEEDWDFFWALELSLIHI